MIEMSVVFPQPDGPTRSVSFPSSTSRSTPRNATVFVPLTPNSLVTCSQDTAILESAVADDNRPPGKKLGADIMVLPRRESTRCSGQLEVIVLIIAFPLYPFA